MQALIQSELWDFFLLLEMSLVLMLFILLLSCCSEWFFLYTHSIPLETVLVDCSGMGVQPASSSHQSICSCVASPPWPKGELAFVFPFFSHRSTTHITSWLNWGQYHIPFRVLLNWLLSNMGQLLDSSHRGHLCTPSQYQSLATWAPTGSFKFTPLLRWLNNNSDLNLN